MRKLFFITLVVLVLNLLGSSSHAFDATWSDSTDTSTEEEFARVLPMMDNPVTPIGIVNSGNACYADSVMQLLMLMDDEYWRKAELEYLPKTPDPNKALTSDQYFLSTVFNFRKHWISGNANAYSNKDNLRAIIDGGIRSRIYTWRGRYSQQDATEFFQGMSNFLGNTNYPSFMLLSTVEFSVDGALKQSKRLELIPSGIELPVPRTSKSLLDMNEIVAAYFLADELKGENQFEYEGRKYNAKKYLRLSGKSDYLFMSLKRFYVDRKLRRQKIDTPIGLGKGLVDLSHFVVDGSGDGEHFEIVGIVMHYGTAYSGHYTARVRYDSQWYLVDDDVAKPTTWTEVSKTAEKNAYLLLLKRR